MNLIQRLKRSACIIISSALSAMPTVALEIKNKLSRRLNGGLQHDTVVRLHEEIKDINSGQRSLEKWCDTPFINTIE